MPTSAAVFRDVYPGVVFVGLCLGARIAAKELTSRIQLALLMFGWVVDHEANAICTSPLICRIVQRFYFTYTLYFLQFPVLPILRLQRYSCFDSMGGALWPNLSSCVHVQVVDQPNVVAFSAVI